MLIPAILETEFNEIKRKVGELDQYTALFQIDIEDGKLVNGKTFLNPKMLDQIETDATFEMDLMVNNPQDFVRERILSVFKVCANIRAADKIPEFIQKAREQDYVVGISINIDTPIELVEPLLTEIDYIQFMGIIPGGQGRKFDKKVINKIKDFKDKYPSMEMQVDGGLDEDTIPKLLKLGIKNYVVGSAIFSSNNPVEVYKKLKEMVHDDTNNLFSLAEE